MQVPQVSVEYDSKYNILYIFVGEPTASDTEKIAKGVYIRRDMFTERISGAIIEEYTVKNRECLNEILPMGLGEHLPIFNE